MFINFSLAQCPCFPEAWDYACGIEKDDTEVIAYAWQVKC